MALEEKRIEAFARRGVETVPRRVRDREGREIYLLERPGERAVVLLHGGGGDASVWLPLVSHLPASWRLLIADRPGHGASYPIDYRRSDFRRLASEFVEDVLDGLGLEEADFIANSMGGFFALAFALDHPERVRTAVLPGAPAGLDRFIPFMLRLLGLPGLGTALNRLSATTDPEVVRKRLYDGLLVKDASKCPRDMLEISLEYSNRPHQRVAWESLLRRVVSPLGMRRDVYIRDEVALLPVRTLFAWGDADAFAPPGSGETLAARMPDARCATVPDAGHLPWIDQPEHVAALAADFIGC